MLRQVFILKGNDVIYDRTFGNALRKSEIEDLSFRLKREAMRKLGQPVGYYDYLKYRIAYIVDIDIDLIFIFVTGLMDDYFRLVRSSLANFKDEFIGIFGTHVNKNLEQEKVEKIDEKIDDMHGTILTKIAVVGFAGVGKTTIKRLIKQDEIPLRHVPTITGDIATIKIGKLEFRLFDFAGQDEFKYLWKGFIKGSHAVLVVTDSTIENIEKSRFFLELKQNEASNARLAIIGNKQDLPGAMDEERIENMMKVKCYPMVANVRENRAKMIRIIADVMEINPDSSPLIKDLFDKESPINIFQKGTTADITPEEEAPATNGIKITKPVTTGAKLSAEERIDAVLKEENKKPVVQTPLKTEEVKEEEEEEVMPWKMESRFKVSGINKYKIELAMDVSNKIFGDIKTLDRKNKFARGKTEDYVQALTNALMCAYLTKSFPEKYPNFASLLQDNKLYVFNSKELGQIKRLYHMYLERMAEW